MFSNMTNKNLPFSSCTNINQTAPYLQFSPVELQIAVRQGAESPNLIITYCVNKDSSLSFVKDMQLHKPSDSSLQGKNKS